MSTTEIFPDFAASDSLYEGCYPQPYQERATQTLDCPSPKVKVDVLLLYKPSRSRRTFSG